MPAASRIHFRLAPTNGGHEPHEATLPVTVPKTPLCALDVASGHTAQVSMDGVRTEAGGRAEDLFEAHGEMDQVEHDNCCRFSL